MSLHATEQFDEYFEENSDVFFKFDHDKEKKEIVLFYTVEQKEFILAYEGEEPNIKFTVKIEGKEYEDVVRRSKALWEMEPPESLVDCLEKLHTLFVDNKQASTARNDEAMIRKKMNDRFEEYYTKKVRRYRDTLFDFDRDVAFAQVKNDIIDAFFQERQNGFRIRMVQDNPYHWIISFFDFDEKSKLADDVEKMFMINASETVEMKLKFSKRLFPAFPPSVKFVKPRFTPESTEKILESVLFADGMHDMLSKLPYLKKVKKVLEQYGRIDFGPEGDKVYEYTYAKPQGTPVIDEMEQLKSKPLLARLVEEAKHYMKGVIKRREDPNFDISQEFIVETDYKQKYKMYEIKKTNSIQFNSYLLNKDSNAIWKFERCVEMYKKQKKPIEGYFCWHGTSPEGIGIVSWDGWAPYDRRHQRAGYGEYFGPFPEMAMYYSARKGCNHLILSYVIKGQDRISDKGEIIVMNPYHENFSYCLPICVVAFGAGKPIDFAQKPLNAEEDFFDTLPDLPPVKPYELY